MKFSATLFVLFALCALAFTQAAKPDKKSKDDRKKEKREWNVKTGKRHFTLKAKLKGEDLKEEWGMDMKALPHEFRIRNGYKASDDTSKNGTAFAVRVYRIIEFKDEEGGTANAFDYGIDTVISTVSVGKGKGRNQKYNEDGKKLKSGFKDFVYAKEDLGDGDQKLSVTATTMDDIFSAVLQLGTKAITLANEKIVITPNAYKMDFIIKNYPFMVNNATTGSGSNATNLAIEVRLDAKEAMKVKDSEGGFSSKIKKEISLGEFAQFGWADEIDVAGTTTAIQASKVTELSDAEAEKEDKEDDVNATKPEGPRGGKQSGEKTRRAFFSFAVDATESANGDFVITWDPTVSTGSYQDDSANAAASSSSALVLSFMMMLLMIVRNM